jgi:hypothetical protein
MPEKTQDTSSPMLVDVLIALQKTFSRLSEQTAESEKVKPARPLALVTGDVTFDLSMNVQPVASGKDWDNLAYNASGVGIGLRLSGKISTDVRVNPDDAKPNSHENQNHS